MCDFSVNDAYRSGQTATVIQEAPVAPARVLVLQDADVREQHAARIDIGKIDLFPIVIIDCSTEPPRVLREMYLPFQHLEVFQRLHARFSDVVVEPPSQE